MHARKTSDVMKPGIQAEERSIERPIQLRNLDCVRQFGVVTGKLRMAAQDE